MLERHATEPSFRGLIRGLPEVLDSLPLAVGIFVPVRSEQGEIVDFRIEHLNAAASRDWNRPRHELLGRSLSGVLRDIGYFEACRDALIGARAVDRVVAGNQLHAEAQGDGVVASWSLGVEPRAASLRSEERFRALADSMPQLVWIADSDGAVSYYNARVREYAGIEQRSDGTWAWQPVVHPEDLERTLKTWADAVEKGGWYACEHRVRMADGSFRWHISRARLVPDVVGATWFGTATDIQDQKLVEEDLRRAVATRDQVVSVVAHDLRNPLAVVRISLPALRHALTSLPEEQVDSGADAVVARLERQVVKMEKLLNELLDAAALQAGRALRLERRDCDLVALLREVVTEQSGHASGHAIDLRVAASPLIGPWDADRLERVLGNLLSNATKYSPRGSVIDVEVERADDCAVVRVSDRGIGIPELDRERIFEWFTRGQNAERAVAGTGIGLAGARRIVEQHGGTLTVESAVGAGSTFTLKLPLRGS